MNLGFILSRRPRTSTAAPASAAVAYTSARRTVGTRASRMSRMVPPPTPVTPPIRTAMNGCMPKSSALAAPATANNPNPAASKIITTQGGDLADELGETKHNRGAEKGCTRIAPIANGTGGNRADQEIANDPATEGGGKREHHQPQQVEIRFNARGCAFHRKDKGAHQIDSEQHSGGVVLDKPSQWQALTFYRMAVNFCCIQSSVTASPTAEKFGEGLLAYEGIRRYSIFGAIATPASWLNNRLLDLESNQRASGRVARNGVDRHRISSCRSAGRGGRGRT